MCIYLYVKQHSITNLKYFGLTQKEDPYSYMGSGKYWVAHINKYGKQFVKTIELWKFENQEEATKFALQFSEQNNIVESKEWANLINETALHNCGVSGYKHSEEAKIKISLSAKNRKHSEETKLKISNSIKGKPSPLIGVKHTKERIEKHRQSLLGRKHLQETKHKMSESAKNRAKIKIQCPHCNKVGSGPVMNRFHFSNCKSKTEKDQT